MPSTLNLQLQMEETQAVVQQRFQLGTGNPKEQLRSLEALFRELNAGLRSAALAVQTGSAAPAAASGTYTLDTVVATDAVTVGSITFTGTDTPSTALHFDTDAGSDALIAASLAAAINDHPTTGAIVTASAASTVVTIAAKQKGVSGNFIPFSSADATITASGSFLAGGTGGVMEAGVEYNAGISF